ncbi:MAG: type ISP restriction/modification enzyme [Cetobacterium sp.]
MTIQKYIQTINNTYISGISTEHSFRGDLQNLIEAIVPNIKATNEPKRIACGAPDYVVTKNNIPIGYIEAKDIGEDLKHKKHKKQFDRYKNSLENLIITDYLTFEFYLNGEKKHEIKIGEVHNNHIILIEKNFPEFELFIKDFCYYTGQTIKSSEKLAVMMADKAKMMELIIERALNSDENNNENSSLKDQMNVFKELLIHDITPKEFADIYAQTIAYGMFAARLEDSSLTTFTRQKAAELIPKSNPFLRKLFQYIAGYELDSRIIWIVDALAEIFRATDIKELLKDFGKTTEMNDPIIHFYEIFLIEYDPKLRKSRGVWYTPPSIVNFIIRSVDELLRKDFNLELGIADYSKTEISINEQNNKNKITIHKTQLLDPATGTGTFLSEVVRFIHSKYFQNQQGSWNKYVEEHLIPRLNGFELLMTSYAMAHIKLELLLKETGYISQSDKRLGIYLTNSLEEHHPNMATLFARWLSEEANAANFIKRDTPVMCIVGNPPYSGESFNKGEWIMKLMDTYKKEPGGKEKLKEKNSKWLNDDYVKFIRYGQYHIEKTGEGIQAFINPHGFLDNPTFRGMRWSLLRSFDKIYIIDLHGNVNKKEVCHDGTLDQNVFNIKQGVSINIFVKTGKKKKNQLAEVFHYDVYGKREEKYKFLKEISLSKIPFTKIETNSPEYFLLPKNFELKKEYDKGFSINQLFKNNSAGIITARDHFSIHHTKDDLIQTLSDFLQLNIEDARIKYNLKKDVRDWKVGLAQEDVKNNFNLNNIKEIAYRPFDFRYTLYTGKTKGFHCMPRNEIMKNFIKNENIGLCLCRQFKTGNNYHHAFISNKIIESSFVSNKTSEITSVFPLYLYKDKINDEFSFLKKNERIPNLDLEIVEIISKKINSIFTFEKQEGDTFTPENILDYIYAILYSSNYREIYKEFLKIDFPKIPYPKNKDNFLQMVNLGFQLRKLHLMENNSSSNILYPIPGNDYIIKPLFKFNKVYINAEQYFENIDENDWNFTIGGYQPAQKWLKDRIGKTLEFEEINHYRKIISILKETQKIMEKIDLVK